MNINQLNPLAALKAESIKAFTSADAHLDRVKREIDELNSATAKAKYSPKFLQDQRDHLKRTAKAAAAERLPDVDAITARIEAAREGWTTEAMMRRAKLSPETEDVNGQILAELRLMRTRTDIQLASASEIVDMAGEAAKAGNLALLEMVRKESTRRDYSTSVEKMQVETAIAKVISEVEIIEQKQALAILDEAQLGVEMAQDTLAEIATGKETDRAKMRRVMAEQDARIAAA